MHVPRKTASQLAYGRIVSASGEPWFYADWMRVLMIHLAVDAVALQRVVPYPLDRHEGRAYVSLVAFTMEHLRPRRGGRAGRWLCRPIATHDFLNVRTYVRHQGEPGIHFLVEWLSNRLAVRLGPATFGLPYRFGQIHYRHTPVPGPLIGEVSEVSGKLRLAYRAVCESNPFAPCEPGTREAWLMERYTAFNATRWGRKFFRVWHPHGRSAAPRRNWKILLCSRRTGRGLRMQNTWAQTIPPVSLGCGWGGHIESPT